VGRRSRESARADDERAAPRSATNPDGMARGYARGRERDEQIRANLEPLAAGERPTAVTVSAVVAGLIGVTNVVFYLAGVDVQGKRPSVAGVLVFAAIMFAMAAGLARARYWAVLGFQALLGITIIIAALSLLVASNAAALLLCVAIAGLGGWLFWKLVRAMARIQMPSRQPRP
jgi:hypothetical protein